LCCINSYLKNLRKLQTLKTSRRCGPGILVKNQPIKKNTLIIHRKTAATAAINLFDYMKDYSNEKKEYRQAKQACPCAGIPGN